MISFNTKDISTGELHQHLLGSVAPRPICFASTISKEGIPNLAPYSFFNVFSSNPPIAIFSSNRRVVNNTTKDTLQNVLDTKEVVINVVSYNIVRQMAMASIDFPSDVSEFDKAGFTPLPSDNIKPFRVKESPVQMECKVLEVKPLGEHGGAGNLIICEIVRMHIQEEILDEDGKIDPQKIDLMGRMGRAYYCRANGDAVMKIFQAVNQVKIGIDQLPEHIRTSEILTGNELAQLADVDEIPSEKDIVIALKDIDVEQDNLHQQIRGYIDGSELDIARALCFMN